MSHAQSISSISVADASGCRRRRFWRIIRSPAVKRSKAVLSLADAISSLVIEPSVSRDRSGCDATACDVASSNYRVFKGPATL